MINQPFARNYIYVFIGGRKCPPQSMRVLLLVLKTELRSSGLRVIASSQWAILLVQTGFISYNPPDTEPTFLKTDFLLNHRKSRLQRQLTCSGWRLSPKHAVHTCQPSELKSKKQTTTLKTIQLNQQPSLLYSNLVQKQNISWGKSFESFSGNQDFPKYQYTPE